MQVHDLPFSPKLLQLVLVPQPGHKKMHHDVQIVDDDPIPFPHSFDKNGSLAHLLEAVDRSRPGLTRIIEMLGGKK